jgi:chemotaxis protein MotB
MKHLISYFTFILMAALVFPSCVAKRKYVAAMDEAARQRDHNAALSNRINQQEDSIAHLMGNVSALGNANEATANELNMSKEQVAAQQKRLMELQRLINQQRENTEALRKRIADALVNFNASQLTVSIKNGKVYVSMQESLLFPSGSAVVNPKGKEALAKVAGVLNTTNDINVDIEGHTDSIPIHNKMYSDNWSLSTARATSIAHVLMDDYHVPPARLIASGRSEYDPVASNSTEDGRALNRRTEIILEPKLDELMDVIRSANNTAMDGHK